MKKYVDFTQGNIVRAIILFSIPLIMGELLQNLYNSVDALVVGNLIDQHALAAVTVCGMIANMVINFFNGMSVGSNIVVAKASGRGDADRLCKAICAAFSCAVVLGLLLALLSVITAPRLLQLAGAQPNYFKDALTYLRVYLAGVMFTVIYNNAAGILRAIGRSDIPFRILLIACCLNIVLDILLTGVMRLGILGVGIATVLSQGVSAMLVYHAINRAIRQPCFNLRIMYEEGGSVISEMLRVGTAAGIQSVLIGFSNIFVTRYMNSFSTEAVAGIGIAQRLDRFVILPAKSFGITMTTYVGQNLGAGQYQRIRQGTKSCTAIALGITIGLSTVIFAFTEQCVSLFSSVSEVTDVGKNMLRVMAPLFWVMALREILLGTLRGCGRNFFPTMLSLIGMVGIRQVFLAVTMHWKFTVENIYYCYPVAWIATLLLLVIYYLTVRKRLLPSKEKI